MDGGFCFCDAAQPPAKAARGPDPRTPRETDTVTTENIDPEIELRRIHALMLEREPDERGQLMGAAFTENGRPMIIVLNAN